MNFRYKMYGRNAGCKGGNLSLSHEIRIPKIGIG